MPLVSGHDVIAACTSQHLVAGAFNTTNIETTMGIVAAVENTGIPTFIQCAPTNAVLSGFDYIYDMVARRLADCEVPVALHLDHGKTLDAVEDALAAKFTSIMIDASEHSYEENVATSANARQLCGSAIALEAELGSIGGKEDEVGPDSADSTDAAQVADFVAAVGCDMLAVSVGNVHGYSPSARINFDLLGEIQRAVVGAAGDPRRLRTARGAVRPTARVRRRQGQRRQRSAQRDDQDVRPGLRSQPRTRCR